MKKMTVTPILTVVGKKGLHNPNLLAEQQPGFSYSLSAVPNQELFKWQFACLKNNLTCNSKLFSLSYTPISEFSVSEYSAVPTIAMFNMINHKALIPQKIYQNCITGKDAVMPHVDILIIDTYKVPTLKKEFKTKALVLLAHSKTAPCFKITSKDGRYVAFGVLLRPSLEKYGEYIFNNIKTILGEDATFELLLSTSYEYNSGTISSSFEKICSVTGIEYIPTSYADPYTDDSLFGSDDIGNNVVMLSF